MKPKDWNKWMVTYGDKTVEYISQSQHDLFVQAIEEKRSTITLKDGRILPTYGRVTLNPEWCDEKYIAKLSKAIQKREEYLKTKRDKELFDD